MKLRNKIELKEMKLRNKNRLKENQENKEMKLQ
jgi:hypothetical protein